MSHSEYTKIYEGNFILVNRIKAALEAVGIIPVIKDESESGRLAGFGTTIQDFQEVFVNNNEIDQAQTIVESVKSEMENFD